MLALEVDVFRVSFPFIFRTWW